MNKIFRIATMSFALLCAQFAGAAVPVQCSNGYLLIGTQCQDGDASSSASCNCCYGGSTEKQAIAGGFACTAGPATQCSKGYLPKDIVQCLNNDAKSDKSCNCCFGGPKAKKAANGGFVCTTNAD